MGLVTEATGSTKKKAKAKSAEEMLQKVHGKPVTKSGNTYSASTSLFSEVNSPPLKKPATKTRTSILSQKTLLEVYASEKRLTIEWFDLGEGMHQNALCFVRLNTSPITVCAGSGMTVKLAHENAARNALKMLK